VVVASVVVGVALRAWFFFHQPINSDEAVAGLMARHFLQGHANAFFWGQPFGGVEPYTVAGLFALGGQSAQTLTLTPILLSAVAAVLVWRVARRLVADPVLAAVAGALAWAAPIGAVYQSTYEGGYRGAAMVLGLLALLFALRILDGWSSVADFVVLGLAAGTAWWALPESVYYLFPAVLVLIGAVVVARERAWWWVSRLGVAVVAFAVGALPWLWDNVGSGFPSLKSSSFPGANTPLNPGFAGRFKHFFTDAVPVQVGLHRMFGSVPLIGGPGSAAWHQLLMALLTVVVVVLMVASVVLCALRGGRCVAIAAAAVAFPLLVALQPGTWYWEDGRYLVYLGTLLALAAGPAIEEAVRLAGRFRGDGARAPGPAAGRYAFSALAVGALLLTVVAFGRSFGVRPSNFFSGWGNPDQGAVAAAAQLRAAGVDAGYGSYWTAYKTDFEGGGKLRFTVLDGVETDRWEDLSRQVARSKATAWLFLSPTHLAAAYAQYGANPDALGPGGETEAAFTARLAQLHIAFRVVHAGLLDAVVPARRVTAAEIGLAQSG
jgi:hypothetical protein